MGRSITHARVLYKSHTLVTPDPSLHAYQEKREVQLTSPPSTSDILLMSYGGDSGIIELKRSFSSPCSNLVHKMAFGCH
jgi:hypothetical protein